jgi:cytidylate kinase
MIITIDGPTASGKSSIARMLAQDLSCYYLYSGLLYRALGYLLTRDYSYSLAQLSTPSLHDVTLILNKLVYSYAPATGAVVTFGNEHLTPCLKTPEVDQYAATVSAHPLVREAILQFQRSLAQYNDLIADGRDCGTVVFPQAEHKFFLTASLEVRAWRWQQDQVRAGKSLDFAACLEAVAARDGKDTSREHSPLIIAPDAQVIDNSGMNLVQTLELFKESIQTKYQQVDSSNPVALER